MFSWPSILSLFVGISGWYYLFYAHSARRLKVVEKSRDNTRRIRLRRANGAAMILLSVLLYLGTRGIDPDQRPALFVVLWMGVLFLLLLIVWLALIDLRLTVRIRTQFRQNGR